MAIKVHFSAGETTKRASSLYQWDYGQQLEIESADLPSLVEVHFACPDMNEALVRPGTVANGVATVGIPNQCLEQSKPITAWVYEIEGTTGTTTKSITIPIIARTRPSHSGEIPQDISDQYTEMITEVNELVGLVKDGDITAKNALHADAADSATWAKDANNATNANTANEANHATWANKSDRMVSTVLSTDILAKALEVAQSGDGVWSFNLSGTTYERENGQYKNLPHEGAVYGEALVFSRYGSPTVMLFAGAYKTVYYNSYTNGGWTGWQTIINSSNIANQSVSHALEADHADRIEGRTKPSDNFLDSVRNLEDGVYHYNIPQGDSSIADNKYGDKAMATVYKYGGHCTVMLWTGDMDYSLYRNTFDLGAGGGDGTGRWTGWQELITSSNINRQTVYKATRATQDANGKVIANYYASFMNAFQKVDSNTKLDPGTYQFYANETSMFDTDWYCYTIVSALSGHTRKHRGVLGDLGFPATCYVELSENEDGTFHACVVNRDGDIYDISSVNLWYRRIG